MNAQPDLYDRALAPLRAPWRSQLAGALGVSLFAAGLVGCAPMPVAQPRPLLMGAPVLTGLAQVRNPQTGTDYFVPCNPCAAPTRKTAVLIGDANEHPVSRVSTAVSRSGRSKPGAHAVVALAMPAAELPIPAGSAQAADVQPVTVVATTRNATAKAASALPIPAPGRRSLPFPRSASVLTDEAKRGVAELLPLALAAERVYIRGRTDSAGSAHGNRALARSRAAAVRAAFVNSGVDPRKLTVSYCTTCFVAPNDTEAGRSANRRVEIELVMSAAAADADAPVS